MKTLEETKTEATRYLRAIQDMLSLLQEQKLSDEQDSYVDTIKHSVYGLARVIAGLGAATGERPPLKQFPKILVVDDDAVQRVWVSRTLEGSGYSVVCATSGSEAIAAAQHNQWDAILMDCEIPQIDGFEATAQIRCQEGVNTRVPIIAYSSYKISGYRERCLKVGMDCFLAKPATSEELLGCIRQAIKGSRGA